MSPLRDLFDALRRMMAGDKRNDIGDDDVPTVADEVCGCGGVLGREGGACRDCAEDGRGTGGVFVDRVSGRPATSTAASSSSVLGSPSTGRSNKLDS